MIAGSLVVLRPVEMTDRDRYHCWLNDPEVVRFLGRRYPFSLAEQETHLKERMTRLSPEHLVLAIETKEGVHIGGINLNGIEREGGSAELGVFIGYKECWGKGYGTDAVRTLLAFAFDEMNLHRVHLGVLEYNERAIACYRKLGFSEEGRLRQHRYKQGRYWDEIVMGVLRDEFFAPEGSRAAEQAGRR